MSLSGRPSLKLFAVSPEVQTALRKNRPVVALESTIITHGGMPFPTNLNTALEVEAIVRRAGCVPATICIKDGLFRVGMSRQELEELAACKDAVKASTRDLGHVLAKRLTASTTVASTLVACHATGIKVFVTGGIGGVHRGNGMDVSADLTELGCRDVAVVCAGAKSILDIGRTLEMLETLGVK